MKIKLRGYQETAIREAKSAADSGKHPCIVLPTGSGKSIVGAYLMSEFPNSWSVTHVRELIEQNFKAFNNVFPGSDSGIYCAGLNKRELGHSAMFASVQSLARLKEAPCSGGLMLIDEAHRVPRGSEAQYHKVERLLQPDTRIGLTATPYRLDSGIITEGDGRLFDVMIEPVKIGDLIDMGYLSPLSCVESRTQIDTNGVRTKAGEFVTADLEQAATDEQCVKSTAASIEKESAGRKRVLVFAVSVLHAKMLAAELGGRAIWGDLPTTERDKIIDWFRENTTDQRFLINCQILTTGFDHPAIDCLAIARPTQSKGLFVQMLGRGMRIAEGKTDCLVLDYGANIPRHVPLEEIPEYRDERPQTRDRQNEKKRAKGGKREDPKLDGLWTGGFASVGDTWGEYKVHGIEYVLQRNRYNPNIRQIMVKYKTNICGINIWLLPEHRGYPRAKFIQFMEMRGLPAVRSASHAVSLLKSSNTPGSIIAKRDNNGFWKVKIEHFPI